MGLAITRDCLVLNRWVPSSLNSVEHVINKAINGQAKFIHPETLDPYTFWEWVAKGIEHDCVIETPRLKLDVPEIALTEGGSDERPPIFIPFSRQNIFKRDDYTCQYCGITRREIRELARVGENIELTLDHLVPRSKGGKVKSFMNVVAACSRCNTEKDDMDAEEFCELHGFEMPRPFNPNGAPWAFKMGKNHPKCWEQFLRH
jgi:hypothetical protein